jgi:hypothetical protein
MLSVANKPIVECRYAECRYAECRYAECRGALKSAAVTIESDFSNHFSNLIFKLTFTS